MHRKESVVSVLFVSTNLTTHCVLFTSDITILTKNPMYSVLIFILAPNRGGYIPDSRTCHETTNFAPAIASGFFFLFFVRYM